MKKHFTFLYRLVLAVTLASSPVVNAMKIKQTESQLLCQLSEELLLNAFSNLTVEDIARYREVCSIFNRLLTDEVFIRNIFKKNDLEDPRADMLYGATYIDQPLATEFLYIA